MNKKNGSIAIVVFGGGCFWCTEAIFKILKGVISVIPGYAGGNPPAYGHKPTYKEVCSGKTGHAEVVKIKYDPEQVSFRDLLTVFFATHDPTTPNQQGVDIGTQYRSLIFYTDQKQNEEAHQFIEELNDSHPEGAAIVTEVRLLDRFYEAEDYHKDYYAKNPNNQYCEVVINPKLKKVQEKFAALLDERAGN